MLDLHDVNAYYGDSHILHGVSLSVGEGEVVSLLGRNGAGKTTTILTVMGYLRPRPGRIVFRGRDISALPPYAVARLGIGFVPQERGIFPSLTVRENLTVFARSAANGPWTLDRIFTMFPSLQARAHNLGFQLSGGEQQMLSIARALMLNPSLLLLDEPSEGLAPMIVQTIIEAITSLKSAGLGDPARSSKIFALRSRSATAITSSTRARSASPAARPSSRATSSVLRNYLSV